MDILFGVLWTVLYFAVVLLGLSVFLKLVVRAPKEIVRKTQHLGYAFSIFLFLYLFDSWWVSVLVLIGFMAVIFVAVWGFEHTPYYRRLLVDRKRKGGEIKYSAILALLSFAILITFFGHVLPYSSNAIVVISVMCWGVGDALAALIGKRFGNKKLSWPGTDNKKTWTGSVAMDIGVFIVAFLMLWFYGGYLWWVAIVIAAMVSSVATFAEAFAKNGWDTLVLPLSAAITLYLMTWLFIGIGVM